MERYPLQPVSAANTMSCMVRSQSSTAGAALINMRIFSCTNVFNKVLLRALGTDFLMQHEFSFLLPQAKQDRFPLPLHFRAF